VRAVVDDRGFARLNRELSRAAARFVLSGRPAPSVSRAEFVDRLRARWTDALAGDGAGLNDLSAA
jgi:hypothetical protein